MSSISTRAHDVPLTVRLSISRVGSSLTKNIIAVCFPIQPESICPLKSNLVASTVSVLKDLSIENSPPLSSFDF